MTRISRTTSVALSAVVLFASGRDVSAQHIELGAFAARGDGPTPAIALGADVRIGVPWISVVGEASSWGTWNVDCPASIPDSFRCSTGGRAYFAGLRLVPPHAWPVRPYLEGKLGKFGPSPIPPGEHRPTARSAEIGARVQLSSLLFLEVGGRKVQVEDRAYEEVFDEEMDYSMFVVRLVAKVR